MAKRWVEPREIDVPQSLRESIGGHPLVAETLVRRGFDTIGLAQGFLDPDQYQPAPASDLPGLLMTVDRLLQAAAKGQRVCVWGDFDVDGQTSAALLVSVLRSLGVQVRYYIPHRERGSHGVHLSVLTKLIDEGMDILLTCDTGISAHEAVAYATARGVDVLISDHHDLPPTLPNALAAVDPKTLPQSHPLHELPGVGVAYKIAEALWQEKGRPEQIDQYLDLVALGIVADVAVQTGDVRFLLQRGLEALRSTKRLGLVALMARAGVNQEKLTEEQISYGLAPRLNALGRLSDATAAVEFLTTEDLTRARILADMMDGLNKKRQTLVDQVTDAAEAKIRNDPSLLAHGMLVVDGINWPGGIIGIVASRLVDLHGLPTVVITVPDDGPARGSARSLEGFSISDALTEHSSLLNRFGGHPMAAGFSINPDRIGELRNALGRTAKRMMKDTPPPSLEIDSFVGLEDLDLALVQDLDRLAPFGPGNPPLVLAARGLKASSERTMGRTSDHLAVVVEDTKGVKQRAVWWKAGEARPPEGEFDLAFHLRVNDYRGQREIQIEWLDARALPTKQLDISVRKPPADQVQIIDYRAERAPREKLKELMADPDLVVWAEAEARREFAALDRTELHPAKAMVIWTAPPGQDELDASLVQVRPEVVHLFAIDPDMDDIGAFRDRLLGLVKSALMKDLGQSSVRRLAAATAQRENTVMLGLRWLEAGGVLVAQVSGDGDILLSEAGPSSRDPKSTRRYLESLRSELLESAAFRKMFLTEDEQSIIKRISGYGERQDRS